MLDMLLFWVVYGLWTVVSWSAVIVVIYYAISLAIEWITHGDKELPDLYEYFTNLCPILQGGIICSFAVSTMYQLVYWVAYTIDSIRDKSKLLPMHNISVNISEFVVTYLSTPIYITLIVGGLLILAHKVYPFIKRVSQSVSKLEEK